MTLAGVEFGAHQGNRMLQRIEESMKVHAEVLADYVRVIPSPNDVAGARLDRFRADVSRDAEFRHVNVQHPAFFYRARQILLAEFRPVHADSVLTNIHKCSDTAIDQLIKDHICLPTGITEREKVGAI